MKLTNKLAVCFIMSDYSVRKAAIKTGSYLKLFGFGTFSAYDGSNTAYVSGFDFTCLSLNLMIGSLVFYLSLSYGLERLSQYSILLALGIVTTMVSGSLVTIISMLIVFWNRQRIFDIIIILEDIMTKFRRINIRPNFGRQFKVLALFACTAVLCIIFGLVVMAVWLGYSSRIEMLVIYGYLSANFGASMGWSATLYVAIYGRLKLLNETIR